MNICPVVDTAFLIDSDLARYIIEEKTGEKLSQDEIVSPVDAEDYLSDFSYCSDFEGEIKTLCPENTENPIDETVSEEYLVYLPVTKERSFFKQAYESPDEMMNEIIYLVDKNGIKMPEDFDWWRYLVNIVGTTVV